MPCSRSQTTVSIEVLPAPMMTNPAQGSFNWTSAFGGTHRTPGTTEKLGGCVDGTLVSASVTSTVFLRAFTSVRSLVASEVTTSSSV